MKLPTTVATAVFWRLVCGIKSPRCPLGLLAIHLPPAISAGASPLANWKPRSMNKRALIIYLMLWMFGSTALFADPGTDYGSWSTVPGWPGLNYRVKRNSSSPGDQTFTWWVQFDNTYNQTITFSHNLTPPNSPPPTLTDEMTLGAGRENADWFIVGSHDSVQVWVGQVTFGDGTPGNAGGSQNSAASSSVQSSAAQAALQQQIQQQQQAAQERQQQLQQQQAALQQQIADKQAELQSKREELNAKQQQAVDAYNAAVQRSQAMQNTIQNATDQIVAVLQQQEAEKEARQAKADMEDQQAEADREQRDLQNQIDQLQQQQQQANDGNNNQNFNNQGVQNNTYVAPVAPAAPPPPEPAHPLVHLSSFFSSDSAPAQKPASSSDLSWITDDKKKSDSDLSWITDDSNSKFVASAADNSNVGGIGYYYRVHSGDTLSAIARAYYNQAHIAVTVNDILNANPGLDADNMKAGQKIFIPCNATETANGKTKATDAKAVQPDIMKQLNDVLH